MGSKNNPGAFDCYANAEPDEPMFVLLARDPLAPFFVRQWADLTGVDDDEKVVEALACATDMDEWRTRNRPAKVQWKGNEMEALKQRVEMLLEEAKGPVRIPEGAPETYLVPAFLVTMLKETLEAISE